jgi:hypothetical protein
MKTDQLVESQHYRTRVAGLLSGLGLGEQAS